MALIVRCLLVRILSMALCLSIICGSPVKLELPNSDEQQEIDGLKKLDDEFVAGEVKSNTDNEENAESDGEDSEAEDMVPDEENDTLEQQPAAGQDQSSVTDQEEEEAITELWTESPHEDDVQPSHEEEDNITSENEWVPEEEPSTSGQSTDDVHEENVSDRGMFNEQTEPVKEDVSGSTTTTGHSTEHAVSLAEIEPVTRRTATVHEQTGEVTEAHHEPYHQKNDHHQKADGIKALLGKLINKLNVPQVFLNNHRYITALKSSDGSLYVPHNHKQSTRKHLAILLGFAEEIVTTKNALTQPEDDEPSPMITESTTIQPDETTQASTIQEDTEQTTTKNELPFTETMTTSVAEAESSVSPSDSYSTDRTNEANDHTTEVGIESESITSSSFEDDSLAGSVSITSEQTKAESATFTDSHQHMNEENVEKKPIVESPSSRGNYAEPGVIQIEEIFNDALEYMYPDGHRDKALPKIDGGNHAKLDEQSADRLTHNGTLSEEFSQLNSTEHPDAVPVYDDIFMDSR